MRFAHFIIVTAVIVGHVSAEESVQPAAGDPAEYAPNAMLKTALPEAPKPQHVIDKKFLVVIGALGMAESMRFTTRTLVLDNEKAAGAPWVTSTPPHPPFIAKNALIFAAEWFVTYEIKKGHDWLPGDRVIRKLWWAYPAAMAGLHIRNAVDNINTKDPSMCQVIDCQ